MKIYSYIPIQKLHYIDKKSLYRQTLDIKGIYTYIDLCFIEWGTHTY